MPLKVKPLAAAQVLQAKPKDKPYRLFDGDGLYLEVVPSGSKYWRLKYRYAGKECRLALGVYPEVSLLDARAKREDARKLLDAGTDPGQDRKIKAAQARVAADDTFEAIALEWHETKMTGWSAVHAKTIMERMTANLFPWLGRRPLAELQAPELLATLRRIESRGAVETTHRCKSIMSMVFEYAVATGRATRNPAADLRSALKTTVSGHHAAIVDPVRVGQLMRDIDTWTGSLITKSVLQISALAFQRPNEIRDMAWTELDLDAGQWVIPSERMKGKLKAKAHGDDHLVPLSRQAITILRDIHPLTGHGPLVFPSERGQGRSISENTARQALRTMGYSNTDHTPHGFRATARTLIREQLHVDREVIERQLAHGSAENLGNAYDRAQFLDKRKAMMQAWADYLDKLRVGAEVIQFKAA